MNHAIEVRAQVVTIKGDSTYPVPNLPAVGMVFRVQPPADPLLIPQLARFQAGYQLNSLARPLELLVQEAARAATGQPAITSQEDAETITAGAAEASEDALVPDGVEARADQWKWPDLDHVIEVCPGGYLQVDVSLPPEKMAPAIAALIFHQQHGRLPFIGGGKMV